jgi:hypothetical protein
MHAGHVAPIGVFHAVATRDRHALDRDGTPYFEINALGVDGTGEPVYEVRLADGTWMLASHRDLD